MRSIFVIACLMGLASPLAAQSQQAEVHVLHAGEMRKTIRQGDTSAHASLDSLLAKPNLVALGPVEDMKGEITVLNSTAYVTKIKGVSATTAPDTDEKAAFLVYAQVPVWKEFPIPSAIQDMTALQDYIRYISKTERFEPNYAFPFLVRGKVASARIHVVNKTDDQPLSLETHDKIKAYFEVTDKSADIVGFYSTKHQGIFTHHGSFTHMHLLTDDRLLSGHVDDLKLQPGKAVLLLPDLPESQRKKRLRLQGSGKKPFKLDTY